MGGGAEVCVCVCEREREGSPSDLEPTGRFREMTPTVHAPKKQQPIDSQ